jgi:hypothetical protein
MTIQDSVEECILALQEKKRELANATIEGKMQASKLTLQDMLKLFKREAESEHPLKGIGMGIAEGSINPAKIIGSHPDSLRPLNRGRDIDREQQRKQQEVERLGNGSAYDRRW